jgi:hypothetical protein
MTPSIRVTAVYEVPCDAEEAHLEIDDFYRSLNLFKETAAYRARLIPLVLIDAEISGADARFDSGNFTQEMELAPQESWQVAYDEAVLSSDGRSVLSRGVGCADGMVEGRLCFYFHYYDPGRAMRWTYGEFDCPTPVALTASLGELIPYQEI